VFTVERIEKDGMSLLEALDAWVVEFNRRLEEISRERSGIAI
jgi:hypothetical protein